MGRSNRRKTRGRGAVLTVLEPRRWSLRPEGPGRSPMRGNGKISKALLDVVQPFLEEGELSRDQVRCVVQFGALAWNLALLDEETRRAETEKVAREVTPGSPEESRAMIGVVLDRKARLHPRDRRFIVSVEVVDQGDNWRVLAAAVDSAD